MDAQRQSALTDIHSHILPGVDDGVQSDADALAMLRIPAAGGVTTQVLTPHYHPGRFDNARAALAARFAAFQATVDAAGIDIRLRLAGEVHIGPEILQMVADDTLPWLGEYRGAKTFLLEFPLTRAPAGSVNLVEWLVRRDILPIVVHPERCREWQDHPERLQALIDLGCPLQITASSLLGQFGSKARELAERLVRDQADRVVLASDSHNLAYRPPDLHLGHAHLAERLDRAFADRCCSGLAAELAAQPAV